jgi:hypothetical protein
LSIPYKYSQSRKNIEVQFILVSGGMDGDIFGECVTFVFKQPKIIPIPIPEPNPVPVPDPIPQVQLSYKKPSIEEKIIKKVMKGEKTTLNKIIVNGDERVPWPDTVIMEQVNPIYSTILADSSKIFKIDQQNFKEVKVKIPIIAPRTP